MGVSHTPEVYKNGTRRGFRFTVEKATGIPMRQTDDKAVAQLPVVALPLRENACFNSKLSGEVLERWVMSGSVYVRRGTLVSDYGEQRPARSRAC